MTSKQKIITSSTLFLIITLMGYLFFRVDLIEKNYVKSIRKSSEKIYNTFRAFEKSKGVRANRLRELEEMVSTINKKIKSLSLLIISGLDYKIDISTKNNKSIETPVYEKIIYEFTNGKITIPEGSEYIVRYYGNESQKKINENRFYLFSKIINKSRIFLVYRYMVDQKSIVKIALESGLIILFFIIFSSLVFIISAKSKEMSITDDDRNLPEIRTTSDIETKKHESLINKTRETVNHSTKNAALDAMNTYIYEMFENISKIFHPSSLSLFTHLSENHFTKSHELKENSFKVIESKTLDTFNLNDDVYRELKKDRIMIMDSGTKSIIPILSGDSLPGFIQFIREDALKKDEITEIRNKLGIVANHLSEYLMISNIMIDRKTGLFSETYFRLKYNEMLQLNKRSNKGFSIILISIFHNSKSTRKSDRLSMIKSLVPAINEIIPVENFSCLYCNYLAILLPGMNKKTCRDLVEKINTVITRFGIKRKEGEIVRSEPLITFSSTEPGDDQNNPAESTLSSMENLIFSEQNKCMDKSIV